MQFIITHLASCEETWSFCVTVLSPIPWQVQISRLGMHNLLLNHAATFNNQTETESF